MGQRVPSVPVLGTASTGGQEWGRHIQQELLSDAHPCWCSVGQGMLHCPHLILLSHSCNPIMEVLNLLNSRAAHRLFHHYLLLLCLCVKPSGCRREALNPGCGMPHGCSVPMAAVCPMAAACPMAAMHPMAAVCPIAAVSPWLQCPHGCCMPHGCRDAHFPLATG